MLDAGNISSSSATLYRRSATPRTEEVAAADYGGPGGQSAIRTKTTVMADNFSLAAWAAAPAVGVDCLSDTRSHSRSRQSPFWNSRSDYMAGSNFLAASVAISAFGLAPSGVGDCGGRERSAIWIEKSPMAHYRQLAAGAADAAKGNLLFYRRRGGGNRNRKKILRSSSPS